MNKKELLELIAPMKKQYYRSLYICICLFLFFKIKNIFVEIVLFIICIMILKRMIKASIWQNKINKEDYSLSYCRVSIAFMDIAIVDDIEIATSFVKGLKEDDEVLVMHLGYDYIIIEKVNK